MIRHIVAWKLKGEAQGNSRENNARIIKERLEGLVGKIPELLRGKVVKTIDACKDYDFAFVSEFESAETLAAYIVNPLHQEVSAFVRSVMDARASIDYED